MEAHGPETLSQRHPGGGWVRLALWFYLAMAGLAWLWRALWRGQPLLFASPEAAARGVQWAPDLLFGLAGGGLAIVISGWFSRRTVAGERLARSLGRVLGPLSLGECLVLAAASGIGEEALFRGALQPSLGLFGASLVFAAVHFAPRRELWVWSLFAFVAGVGLGLLFDATGNLVAPIVAHATLNGVNLRLLAQGNAAREDVSLRSR